MINNDDVARVFWRVIDQRIDERVNRIVEDKLRNLRPGGAHPFVVEVVSPTVSLTVPVAKLNVDYPCWITSVDVYGDPGVTTGTATVDIYVARPGQKTSQATSIFGSGYVYLLSGASSLNTVATSSWNAFLESNTLGNSVILPYVAAVSSVTSLTITVNVRAQGSY